MFRRARLKLTAWYLLIIMSVSMTFSFVIARSVSMEIERFERIQRYRIESSLRLQTPIQIIIPNPELLEETKRRVFMSLLIINVGIFVTSGVLGYILAGRTLAPIQVMMDEQSRFVSDASHELRTPLTSLKSAFEVFLRSKHPSIGEAKVLALESIDEVDKLQSLSDSLLQLTQYQNSSIQTKFELISLHGILKDAMRKVEAISRKKEVTIEYNEQEIDVVGNKHSLIELFVILLDNAVKYSSRKQKIRLYSEKKGSFVLVTVQDYGLGIEKKDIPHIFDRFYRADAARSKTNAQGYGLGLSIAKKIIDVHGGSIQVKSMPKKGSQFIVKIPFSAKHQVNEV